MGREATGAVVRIRGGGGAEEDGEGGGGGEADGDEQPTSLVRTFCGVLRRKDVTVLDIDGVLWLGVWAGLIRVLMNDVVRDMSGVELAE